MHDMIIKMREGYDTQIGEQGTALSAGQAQRVALARALYGNPFLIVLDEPNSNLDTEGDEALTRAVRAARERGAIVVVVAHRPIGIEAVDQLLVLKDGRMQAFGPKETVLGQVLQRVGAAVADQDRLRRGSCQIMTGSAKRGARQLDTAASDHRTGAWSLVLAGGLGGWASTAQISGALIAPGAVVVDSNVKKVQHPTGGVVGEVRARDGDIVKAGDIVVRLDETVIKASLAIVIKTLERLVGAGGAAGGRAARPRQRSNFRRCSSIAPTIPTSRTSWPAKPNCSRFASTDEPDRSRSCASASPSSTRRSPASTAQEQAKDKEIALVEKELVGVR